MTQKIVASTSDTKQRLTAFVDPVLAKRAKIQGAIEGLTISEVVEKALDVYAPKIEKKGDQQIHLKFISGSAIGTFTQDISSKSADLDTNNRK